jgi:hypothetical protein
MEADSSSETSVHINQTAWHPSRIFLLYSLLLQVCVLFVNLIRFLYLGRWVGVGHWTEMFLLQAAAVALPLLPVVFPIAWLILDSLGMARIQALVHMPSQSQVSKRNLLLKSTNECRGTKYIWHSYLFFVLLSTFYEDIGVYGVFDYFVCLPVCPSICQSQL